MSNPIVNLAEFKAQIEYRLKDCMQFKTFLHSEMERNERTIKFLEEMKSNPEMHFKEYNKIKGE